MLSESPRDLSAGAGENRNASVDDDADQSPENTCWMCAGSIVAGQDVGEIPFDDHAGVGIFGELRQFAFEALSIPNDRMNEILESLALHRDG